MLLHLITAALILLEVESVVAVECGVAFRENPEKPGICCHPVFNCPPGNQIKRCNIMHGRDECIPCPSEYVQPDYISSKSDLVTCFKKRNECTAQDSTYSREDRPQCYGTRSCKCNLNDCFADVDNSCVCVRVPPCDEGKGRDPLTGECKKCGRFEVKPKGSCLPCLINENAWREWVQQHTTTPSTVDRGKVTTTIIVQTKTENPLFNDTVVYSLEPSVTPTVKDDQMIDGSDQDIGVIVGVIVGVLLTILIIIIVAVIICCKCRPFRHDNQRNRKWRKLLFCQKERRNGHNNNELGVEYNPVDQDDNNERVHIANQGTQFIENTDSTPNSVCIIDSVPNNSVISANEQNTTSFIEKTPNHSADVQNSIAVNKEKNHHDLSVVIPPKVTTSFVSNDQSPKTSMPSIESSCSGQVASPVDDTSPSQMVTSSTPFESKPIFNSHNPIYNSHNLIPKNSEETRKKELVQQAVIRPYTATPNISSAAQSYVPEVCPVSARREAREGEEETNVKQPDQGSGDTKDS